MLPPIFPRPMNPIFTGASSLVAAGGPSLLMLARGYHPPRLGIECAAEERLHGGEPRVWVCAEVDAEDGEAVVNQ